MILISILEHPSGIFCLAEATRRGRRGRGGGRRLARRYIGGVLKFKGGSGEF
jgi:hypothetical protein